MQVREAVTWLDLDVIMYPCPQGGPTFREYVKETAGKSMFPYMVDDNTVGPGRHCSPRHRMPFDFRNEGSNAHRRRGRHGALGSADIARHVI